MIRSFLGWLVFLSCGCAAAQTLQPATPRIEILDPVFEPGVPDGETTVTTQWMLYGKNRRVAFHFDPDEVIDQISRT